MKFRNYESCMRTLGRFVALLAVVVPAGCGGGGSRTAVNNSSGGGGPAPASISGTIAVGTAPWAVAVDSSTDKIYVTDYGTLPPAGDYLCDSTGADVTVIDADSGTRTTVPLVGVTSFTGAVNPIAIALNPGSHTAYIVQREWGPGLGTGKGCFPDYDGVVGLDTSTLKVTRVYSGITAGGSGFLGVQVNQATGDVYLSDAGTLLSRVGNSTSWSAAISQQFLLGGFREPLR